jgi:hypothetical protein
METEQKSTGSRGTVIAVVVAVIVTAVIVGGGVYLWQQNKSLKEQTKATSTPTSKTVTSTVSAYPSVETTRDMTNTGISPSDITEEFMLSTLGTLPGAKIDYAKAKTLASQKLLAQWTDDSFVPQFYGIQDGPTTYEITTQSISGTSATVKVEVRWAETGLAWAFSLVDESGWKINSFRNDAQ